MRLDSKFGRWLFIGSGIMFTAGLILLLNGSKSGLFLIVIGGYILFHIIANPH